MKKNDMNKILKDGFPSVPESFHLQLEETLRSIEQSEEKETMKGTFKKTWVFVLAALLILGTALAAGTQSGLMDFILNSGSAKPLENAQASIQKNLGSAECGGAVYTVHEAVYDGECVRALVEVAPASPETHAVHPSFDPDFVSEQLNMAAGGKTIVDIPCPVMETNSDSVPMDFMMTVVEGMRTGKNGSIFMYLMSPVAIREYAVSIDTVIREAEQPASKLPVRFIINPDAYYENMWEECALIPFTLDICEADTIEYAAESMKIGNLTVNSVCLTNTPFASYLEIEYAYKSDSSALRNLSETTCYTTVKGKYFHTLPDCSGMRNAAEYTYKEAAALGKESCPSCAVSVGKTYYATETGVFLHTIPDCSGMRNAIELTYEEALAMNKDFLCPVCAGGSAEAVMTAVTGEQYDFEVAAADAMFFEGRTSENRTNYSKTYIFSAETDFPGEITLTLLEKGVSTGNAITLRRK